MRDSFLASEPLRYQTRRPMGCSGDEGDSAQRAVTIGPGLNWVSTNASRKRGDSNWLKGQICGGKTWPNLVTCPTWKIPE